MLSDNAPHTAETPAALASLVRNALPDNCWPAIPDEAGARALAMQFQLEQTQWWPVSRLREEQLRQLAVLLAHARDTVPFYRQRLAHLDLSRDLDAGSFAALPLLSRRDVQTNYEALLSTSVPAEHGRLSEAATSGSTGTPVQFRTTELCGLFWQVFTLRDHLWHRRDLSGKLGSLRGRVQPGGSPGWGPATDDAFVTGPLVMFNTNVPMSEQADWLMRENPDYLITIASNARALALYCTRQGLRPPALREVRTYGEALHPDIREICRTAWNVPVVDMYSCSEGGYLALQCPEHEHYHLQAESVLLEVLNGQGAQCAPGETGRVVITPLHNFAMPLVRYELGDYAEMGEPCECGRGLPVLRRILGKTRHMLRLPDGGTHFPRFGEAKFPRIAPIHQFQVVQTSLDAIEVRLVVARALTGDEETKLREHVLANLKHGFRISFVYVAEIPRAASGKYEDFRCEIPPAGG